MIQCRAFECISLAFKQTVELWIESVEQMCIQSNNFIGTDRWLFIYWTNFHLEIVAQNDMFFVRSFLPCFLLIHLKFLLLLLFLLSHRENARHGFFAQLHGATVDIMIRYVSSKRQRNVEIQILLKPIQFARLFQL